MNQEAVDQIKAERDAAVRERDAMAQEIERLRNALNAAGRSLETIAMLAGRNTYGNPPIETFMATHEEVRAYAAFRASAALKGTNHG